VGDFMKLFFDLFKEFVPAYIEIRGRETVLLEGFSRIENYSDTEIILCSENDKILIKGESLCLCHLSSERISVKGRINGIEFI
jgi:sporulation protein YqfC